MEEDDIAVAYVFFAKQDRECIADTCDARYATNPEYPQKFTNKTLLEKCLAVTEHTLQSITYKNTGDYYIPGMGLFRDFSDLPSNINLALGLY